MIMGKYKLPFDYDKLTWQERREVREQYIEDQVGLCYWCKCDLDLDPPKEITDKEINWEKFPPNFLKHPIHLQHDHYTGWTEGAVHSYCNAVMWQYHNR